jgi:hypothetical protein
VCYPVRMNVKTLNRLVERSKKLAMKISHDGNRHFSFVLDGRQVLSIGINNILKTHSLSFTVRPQWPFIHSEAHAIKSFPLAPACLEGLAMFNVRLNKLGEVRLSKPCKFCQKLLGVFGISEVYFTTETGFESL